MLKKDNRFDSYAYRIATREIAASVTYLEEGSWVTLDTTTGKVKPAAADANPAFLCLTSERNGRDNVKSQGAFPKAAYYLGAFEVTVANNPDAASDTAFDHSGTYAPMTPLKIKVDATTAQAILTPATPGTDDAKVVAYAMGAADTTNKTLRICVL